MRKRAANGGLLGCNYTQAQVEQALQQQTVTVGKPIAPVQDPNSGQWVIYEVTSQSLEPLSAAASGGPTASSSRQLPTSTG